MIRSPVFTNSQNSIQFIWTYNRDPVLDRIHFWPLGLYSASGNQAMAAADWGEWSAGSVLGFGHFQIIRMSQPLGLGPQQFTCQFVSASA